MAAIPLIIPTNSLDLYRVPRLMRGDDKLDAALRSIQSEPDSVRASLLIAGGMLMAGGFIQGSAAVLVATLTLFPDTDFSN